MTSSNSRCKPGVTGAHVGEVYKLYYDMSASHVCCYKSCTILLHIYHEPQMCLTQQGLHVPRTALAGFGAGMASNMFMASLETL